MEQLESLVEVPRALDSGEFDQDGGVGFVRVTMHESQKLLTELKPIPIVNRSERGRIKEFRSCRSSGVSGACWA